MLPAIAPGQCDIVFIAGQNATKRINYENYDEECDRQEDRDGLQKILRYSEGSSGAV